MLRGRLERIVDVYRKRWVIEYFKALKSGCALEKWQVSSYPAMCRGLSLLAPIACRLLLVRAAFRDAPKRKATTLFDAVELKLIAQAQVEPVAVPTTIEQALALLARLGGHITNNGPPGWQTLARGYETWEAEVHWVVANSCVIVRAPRASSLVLLGLGNKTELFAP